MSTESTLTEPPPPSETGRDLSGLNTPVEKDLPGGARRLVQKAEGIKATVVNGAVAFEDGEATGAYAGQVLKGKLAS